MTREESLKAELRWIKAAKRAFDKAPPEYRSSMFAAVAEAYAPVPAAAHHEKPAKP